MIDTAVLLAAGRGSRLRPHTDTVPKPLLPWNGRATIDHLVDGLRHAGIRRIIVVVHHLAAQLEAWACERARREDGLLAIECVRQPLLGGTAEALQVATALLPDRPVLLSATDYLLPAPFYQAFLRFHAGHDAGASVGLKRVPAEQLAARSSARFDTRGYDEAQGGEVLEIVEKPATGTAPSAIGANLLFVLPPPVMTLLPQVAPSPRGEREVQSAVNAWLAGGGRCRGLVQEAPSEWTPGTR